MADYEPDFEETSSRGSFTTSKKPTVTKKLHRSKTSISSKPTSSSKGSKSSFTTKTKKKNNVVVVPKRRVPNYSEPLILEIQKLTNMLTDAETQIFALKGENKTLAKMQKIQEKEIARIDRENNEMPQFVEKLKEELRVAKTQARVNHEKWLISEKNLKDMHEQFVDQSEKLEKCIKLLRAKNLEGNEALQAKVKELTRTLQEKEEQVSKLLWEKEDQEKRKLREREKRRQAELAEQKRLQEEAAAAAAEEQKRRSRHPTNRSIKLPTVSPSPKPQRSRKSTIDLELKQEKKEDVITEPQPTHVSPLSQPPALEEPKPKPSQTPIPPKSVSKTSAVVREQVKPASPVETKYEEPKAIPQPSVLKPVFKPTIDPNTSSFLPPKSEPDKIVKKEQAPLIPSIGSKESSENPVSQKTSFFSKPSFLSSLSSPKDQSDATHGDLKPKLGILSSTLKKEPIDEVSSSSFSPAKESKPKLDFLSSLAETSKPKLDILAPVSNVSKPKLDFLSATTSAQTTQPVTLNPISESRKKPAFDFLKETSPTPKPTLDFLSSETVPAMTYTAASPTISSTGTHSGKQETGNANYDPSFTSPRGRRRGGDAPKLDFGVEELTI